MEWNGISGSKGKDRDGIREGERVREEDESNPLLLLLAALLFYRHTPFFPLATLCYGKLKKLGILENEWINS